LIIAGGLAIVSRKQKAHHYFEGLVDTIGRGWEEQRGEERGRGEGAQYSSGGEVETNQLKRISRQRLGSAGFGGWNYYVIKLHNILNFQNFYIVICCSVP
jgi:hypothetical protein